MQSKLAATMDKSVGIFSSIACKRVSMWARAASSKSRTADPTIHAGDPKGIDADDAAKAKQPIKPTPYASSPTIQNWCVNEPLDPLTQQKRGCQAQDGARPWTAEEVVCVGVDGTPLSSNIDEREKEDDDIAYYKEHKASPLSEIVMADTRKPIRQVTDSNVVNGYEDAIGWKEEQLDTDEEALMRAMRIWKESAMRGVPEYPHSRALRAALLARGVRID